MVVQRDFFTLDLHKDLDRCTQSCHLCASLKKVPSSLVEYSTSDSLEGIGLLFTADVMKWHQKLVLIIPEISSSYTSSCLLDERLESLHAGPL